MNPALRLLLILVFTIVWTAPSTGQTADELIASRYVMIRHRLDPEKPVLVGEPVKVWIEVLTQNWFLRAPVFPAAVEVKNAIVIPPESFAVNSSERIDGETHAVQARAYTVFAQTSGRVEVPSIEVKLVVALDGAKPSPEITLRTQPFTIETRLPAAAEGLGLVLATPQLSVRETYSRSLDGIRVGESFKRTVTMTIENSVAMLLPPLGFEVGDGIAVYPGRPEVTDQRARGSMEGTRVETVTYALETEGGFEIPEIVIPWWNLGSAQLVREVLPAVELVVEPNPDLAAEHLGETDADSTEVSALGIAGGEDGTDWRLILGVIAGAALLLVVVFRLAARKRTDPGPTPKEIEAQAFRRFQKAASSNDPALTHATLLSWLDRTQSSGSAASVREFASGSEDPELLSETESLEHLLYSGEGVETSETWSGRQLAGAVRRVRRRRLEGGALVSKRVGGLPPLNPGGR